MRIALGIWSIFVPGIVALIGYSVIEAVATSFFIVSMIIVAVLAPNSQGKSLEEVIKEFCGEKGKETVSPLKPKEQVKQKAGLR